MAIHNKKPKRETNKKKWLVAASLLAIGVVGLQTPLLADIKELFFGGSYKGVEMAIEKGYLESLEGIVSTSNGLTIEVIGGLIDPTVIQLRLRLTAEDPKVLESFKDNRHTGLLSEQFNITDDQGRVIQEIREDGAYCPPFINEQGEQIHLMSSSSEQIDTHQLEEGEIQVDMILNSSEGNYKRIKGLTLQSNELNNIEGDWLLDVTFPSEMTEIRETIYEVASPNDQIELTSAVAMKTGTKIDCIIKAPVDENVITAKIIGEDGTVFTTGRAGWMESTPNGERVVLTFEALEEDLGDSFTVQFPTLSGRDESITLTKVVQ